MSRGLLGFLLAVVLGVGVAQAGRFQVEVRRPGGFATAVAQTPDGYLWVGTKLGLFRHDGARFVSFSEAVGLPQGPTRIRSLAVDKSGALWIATHQDGLFRWAQGGLSQFGEPDGLPSSSITQVAVSPDDTVWVRTARGLVMGRPGSWRVIHRENDNVESEQVHLLFDGKGGVVTEADGGVFRISPNAEVQRMGPLGRSSRSDLFVKTIGIKNPMPTMESAAYRVLGEQWVRTLIADARGRLWAGTRYGIFVLERGVWIRIGTREGLPDQNIRQLFEDREGNIWAVTHGGGLARVSAPSVYGLTTVDGLGGNTVFSVIEDRRGIIWITGTEGLNAYKDGVFTVSGRAEGISDPFVVRSLGLDKDDRLWIGTETLQLFRRSDSGFVSLSLPARGVPDRLSALGRDSDDVFWAASFGGLFGHWDGDVFVPHPLQTPPCSRPADWLHACPSAINVVVPRRAGGAWVGTFDGSVGIATKDTLVRYQVATGSLQSRITAIHEDTAGVLFVGTERGLYVLPRGVPLQAPLRPLGRDDGLPDERQYAVMEDDRGRLWIGSERGLLRVEKAAVLARAKGEGPPLAVTSFTPQDGVPSEETMGSYDPPAIRAHDGRMYVMTTAGVTVIDPRDEPRPFPAPGVHIEEIVFDGRTMNHRDSAVSVPPGRGELAFQYTATAMRAPQRVRFRHRLEGYESAFREVGTRRAAQYTNLPPGRYTFRVQAFVDDEPRAVGTTSRDIFLSPHFYQTVWFRLMLLALALGGVAMLFWLRGRRARARFALVLDERQRIARDLHDTLAQVFSALGFQIDAVRRDPNVNSPVLANRLAHLRRVVTEGRRAARTAIWNLRTDPGESLEKALGELTRQYPELRMGVTVEGVPYPLPLAAENELLLIAQQAVSNALEHGDAAQISLCLEYEPARFSFWIRDDGRGFDASAVVDGAAEGAGHFGVGVMRERAQRAGGRLQVESTPGVGTEIGVIIERSRSRKEESI